ncbi:MAG: efflux RND transporter periplasmic adaptor subunit [Sedimenticolaceae bacterium]
MTSDPKQLPAERQTVDRSVPVLAAVRCTMLGAVLWSGVGATAAPTAPPVVIASTEQRAVFEEVPISGTVSSPRVAQLSPEVAGLVQEVLVDAGDRVAAGAPLVRLDGTLAGLALEAAEAATEQASEELADARRRLADAERLVQSRGIAETEIKARRSEVRADAATLRLRQAEQHREAERLRRYELKAPFSGVISRKLTETGEWVAPGDEVLELMADTGLRIDFRVPQGLFPRIRGDEGIEVRLDALPDRSLAARIGEIVPISDPSARTFLVRVYPQDEDLPMTPGMSASATLRLGTGEQGVVVSRDALLRHPDGRITVWVAQGQGSDITVSERQVQTGLSFDGRVVIRSGLEPEVRVVVEGNEALQQGQRVSVRETR